MAYTGEMVRRDPENSYKHSPRVSVIIPCYNYAHYLPDAVNSVVGQTYRDFEVIIVNDGSPDNTAAVALGLIEKYRDCEIRLINQENSGLPATRNNGIKAARGDYVLPLDADDMLKPSYIEKLMDALDNNRDACLAYSWTETFGDWTEIYEHGGFDLKTLVRRQGPPSTILMNKSAWDAAGGYKTAMRGYEEWEFTLSLYELGCRSVVVAEPLFMYRMHGHSMVGRSRKKALTHTRALKMLHPTIFAPYLSRFSLPVAKAAIWLRSWLRDPLTRFLYLRFPGLHGAFARLKYDVLGFLWRK